MTEKLGDAVLELRTGDRGFQSGIERAEARARQLARTFDDVGRKAVRLGRDITTFVTLPVIALGALSVKTASDVQEMQSLFNVTFEDAAAGVEEWAARTAAANQRSRFEFMRTAADFAAFLKPLGVAPDLIVPMSKALTQLTTDVSSFRNMAEEEVFTRLFSGLAGETEAVRRLGIDIGAAAVEAELLRMGINKSQAEATQAEKVMARFSLIMRQTADAQGDAVRTAGSFENQARGLGAVFTDLRVAIGQRFLPVAQMVVTRLRDLGQQFLQLPGNVQSGIIAIVSFVAVIGPAIVGIGLLARAIGFAVGGLAFLPRVLRGVWVAVRTTIIAIQVAVVGFLAFFSTIPGIIITALTAVLGALFIWKDTVIGFFKGLVIAIKNELVAGFNNLVVIPFQNLVNGLILGMQGLPFAPGLEHLITVNDVIDNDFTKDFAQVLAEAKESGAQELEEFKSTATRVVNSLKGKFGELKAKIGEWIPDIELADITLENIGAGFDDLLRQFGLITDAINQMGEEAGAAGATGAQAFDEFGMSIKNSVEDNLTAALSRIRDFGDAARAILMEVIEAFIRFRIVQPIVDFFSPDPIKKMATGGRFSAGEPFIAGERGPEMVLPDRSGTVIPNHKIGGMGGNQQIFNFPLAFPPQLEAFIRNTATVAARDTAMAFMGAQRGRL